MHYICTGGCRGVSEKPGTCQAKNCPKHGMPLEACDCRDGRHDNRELPPAEKSRLKE